MTIKHRRTLWIHTAFSLVMCLALLGIILLRRDVPAALVALFLLVYILGNTYIHVRRDDFKRDTLYEYLLLGAAVFIVLSSAAIH